MAVNETIVTGRYFRRCTDAANKVWQRISFWHKASDCEFDDNKNAQTKVGAIKGITTSTSVTETGYAADMTTVKNLQTQIDELNSNLGAKLLWTNDNPSSNFLGQTITLDLTNYDGVIIEFNVAKSVNSLLTRAYIRKNDNSQYLSVGGLYNPSNAKSRGRTISVNNNGITLGNGYTDATDNGACIPIKIYGLHLSLN